MFRRSLFRQLWRHASRRAQAFRVHLHCEQLEQRAVPAVYPLTPAAVRHAYGFDQIVGDGAGQTIAIIDAYDAPNIFKDADNFDKTFAWSSTGLSLYSQFGASSSWLTKVSPSGRLPRANVGWAEEISLDVEWAHAIAPAAKIMLVEASSNSLSALLGAVDYATNHGAQVVSMSWGSNEFSGETAYDFHFNHPGVTYVASAGDVGGVTEWPAVSPNVVSVGGTSLKVDTSGNYLSESSWTASGGGISAYESKPSYQSGITLSATKRTSPDVGYDANPNTGFWVYDSYGAGGWGEYGGTSAGAPQIAALVALANQGRSTPLSSSGTLKAIYDVNAAASFNDVSSGNAGSNVAGTGYDLIAGLGTPKAASLIVYLQGGTISSLLTKTATPSSSLPDSETRTTTIRGTSTVGGTVIFVANLSAHDLVFIPGASFKPEVQPEQPLAPPLLNNNNATTLSRAQFQQLGQVIEEPEDDATVVVQSVSTAAQMTPARTGVVSDQPQWLPLVDAVFSDEVLLPEEAVSVPAPAETSVEESSMVAAMTLLAGTMIVGTRYGATQDRDAEEKKRRLPK